MQSQRELSMTDTPACTSRPTSPARRLRAASRSGIGVLAKVLMLGLIVAGCQPDLAGDGGSTGMFGLFKGKAAKLPSAVAPELRAALKHETALPGAAAPAQDTRCAQARVDGTPPKARFAPPEFDGSTRSALRVASRPGLPPLAIVNMGGDVRRPQFWELASDGDATFVRQIPVQLDAAEGKWVTARAIEAGCLPGPLVALGLAYATGDTFQSVVTYDRATHQVRKLADAVYDASTGHPDSLLDTRAAGADRALLLYHTGELRLRAEVYLREYDHILVFSPQHPQGLEVLKLGLDDGNVVDWLVAGKTLWLHTQDRRNEKQPGNFFWSLDLSAVL
jgi:hypothetical protein